MTYVELGGKRRPLGVRRCDCPEAQAHWARVDEQRRQREELLREMEIEQLIHASMIPARWRNRTFESFQVTDENRKAYETAKTYAETFDPAEGKGLLFTGTVGTGKTHLAAAITMYLLGQGQRVVFGTFGTLLAQLRHTYDGDGSERDVMRRFMRCPLLVIDDLGKEKVTDWVEQTIYEIVNTRYEDCKSLVITTNLSLTELRSRYPTVGDALVDRIIEMCQGVKMVGDSWRKKGVMG
jgi:DNA replication protein DnaC